MWHVEFRPSEPRRRFPGRRAINMSLLRSQEPHSRAKPEPSLICLWMRWSPKCLLLSVIILLQLAIQSLTTDTQRPCCMRLVSLCIVKRRFNRLPFDLFHRGGNRHFKSSCATFTGSLSSFNLDSIAFLEGYFADRLRQILQFDLAPGSDNHGAFNRVLKLTNISGPLVSDQGLQGVF